jgi:hypothetical protein
MANNQPLISHFQSFPSIIILPQPSAPPFQSLATLIMRLHLMIPPHSLLIRRRHRITAALPRRRPRPVLLLLHRRRRRRAVACCALLLRSGSGSVLRHALVARTGLLHYDVCHARFGVGYVVVVVLGELRDYVPGVEEPGEESEHAEENVDYAVDGADAAFYPDLGRC